MDDVRLNSHDIHAKHNVQKKKNNETMGVI